MSIAIVPFDRDLIPAAADLLAARHTHDRAVQPLLAARYADPATARAAIEAALDRPHASGFAALENRRLVGYLAGHLLIDTLWGRSGWVRPAGYALAPGQPVTVLQQLYAALGARWVEWGCFTHFVLLPLTDAAVVQAWFELSFGIQQVHALLDLAAADSPHPTTPAGITIRQAGPGDEAALSSLSDVIWQQQIQAPTWAVQLPEADAELHEGWAELATDDSVITWLAFNAAQEAVGAQVYYPAEPAPDALYLPDQTMHLSVSATRQEARGQGIGLALTHTGLAHARAAGYACCETDWRSANLGAAHFWPRRGFTPVAYRLVRYVDPRIAWATGSA